MPKVRKKYAKTDTKQEDNKHVKLAECKLPHDTHATHKDEFESLLDQAAPPIKKK